MSGYSVVRVRDVTDQAAAVGMDPDHFEIRFLREPLELRNFAVTVERFAGGWRPTRGHRHKTQEEVFIVVDGSGRVKLDDEIVELRPLDALRVAPTVTRAFEAGPEGLEYLAFGPHHKGDGSLNHDPTFWD